MRIVPWLQRLQRIATERVAFQHARRGRGTTARTAARRDQTLVEPSDEHGRKGYRALLAITKATTEVKKSRFLAIAAPCDTPEQAMRFVADASDASASHNCYGYKMGPDVRSSDDGEPSGTAGRQILAAIEQAHMDHVVCLVTRHFGGPELGVGGLGRAYRTAAAAALDAASTTWVVPRVTVLIDDVLIADVGAVYSKLEVLGATREDEEYCDVDGTMHIEVVVDESKTKMLVTALRDATAGKARIRILP